MAPLPACFWALQPAPHPQHTQIHPAPGPTAFWKLLVPPASSLLSPSVAGHGRGWMWVNRGGMGCKDPKAPRPNGGGGKRWWTDLAGEESGGWKELFRGEGRNFGVKVQQPCSSTPTRCPPSHLLFPPTLLPFSPPLGPCLHPFSVPPHLPHPHPPVAQLSVQDCRVLGDS